MLRWDCIGKMEALYIFVVARVPAVILSAIVCVVCSFVMFACERVEYKAGEA